MFEALMSLLTLSNVGAAGVGGVLVVLSGMAKRGLASVFSELGTTITALKVVKAKIDADAAEAKKVIQMASIPAKPPVSVITVTAAPPALTLPAATVAPVAAS